MKIAVVSDSHDNGRLLEAAAVDAQGAGAEALLHCGDVVAPNTLRTLQKHALPVHVIHGNNTGDLYGLLELSRRPGSVIRYHGQDAALTLGGRRIFMVHYPHYARALALTGDWDIVCFGHDHKPAIALVATIGGGRTLLINPGTVGGIGATPTYVLCDLADLSCTLREIDGH